MASNPTLEPEQIQGNWKKFRSLCEKLGDRAPAVLHMLDELDMRLCLCPGSANLDYHGCFPGGLVDHSIRVLNNLVRLNKAYDWNLSRDEMIVSALFHDIGKVGLPGPGAENDFYVEQTDNWKREKRGQLYAYNNDIVYMSTPDRSVFMMQHYGVRLSADEWLAIRCNDGFVLEQNRSYCLKVSPLVYGLMTADYVSTMEEKNVGFWPAA